jgi:hypothetical protein
METILLLIMTFFIPTIFAEMIKTFFKMIFRLFDR